MKPRPAKALKGVQRAGFSAATGPFKKQNKSRRKSADMGAVEPDKAGTTWADLPADILILILGQIDTKSRLAASASCKSWRAVLLDKSSKLLTLQQFVVENSCENGGCYMSMYDMNHMIKFMPFVNKVVFKWCASQTEKMLRALTDILHLEEIPVNQLEIKGNFAMERGHCNRREVKEASIKKKIELFSTLLKRCTHLKELDFGFEPDLSRNEDILNIVKEKAAAGTLQGLNIAVIHVKPLDDSISLVQLGGLLTTLCLSWDRHFVDLVGHLAAGTEVSGAKLKDLIVVVAKMVETCDVPDIEEDQWQKLSSSQPQLSLKLVLVEDDLFTARGKPCKGRPSYVGKLHEQLRNGQMPMKKLAVVWSFPKFENLFQEPTLRGDGFKEVEEFTWLCMQKPDPKEHLYYGYAGFLMGCKKMKKLELDGMFIIYQTVLQLAYHLGQGAVLRDITVYEKDVYSKKGLNIKHFEESMSEFLNKEWHALKEGDMSTIDPAGGYTEKMERVLQRACNICSSPKDSAPPDDRHWDFDEDKLPAFMFQPYEVFKR